MRVDAYLDDQTTPFQTLTPPEHLRFDTTKLDDGPHRLRFRASDEDGSQSERALQFNVGNGPAIAIHGIRDGDTVAGTVLMLVNAYGAQVGDAFEPRRIETPAPIPTWAWVLSLLTLGWAIGYASLEFTKYAAGPDGEFVQEAPVFDSKTPPTGDLSWSVLGEQVYGNHCAACHRNDGEGLPGVFPPLKGNATVLADDPREQIRAVINGLSGKVIDGVAYASPMPAFGAQLTDEQIAAVINHERRSWGQQARTVTPSDVAAERR